MYIIRQWSVTHSRKLEAVYYFFEPFFIWLFPLWRLIGRERVEKPMRLLEKAGKNLMFDCQMCGQCALSSTGMSCPTNCPKSLRNGPCGGVRGDGNCEVIADMRCVWVEAFEGSLRMRDGDAIEAVLPPVDHRRFGTSSWLSVTQEAAEQRAAGRAVEPVAAE